MNNSVFGKTMENVRKCRDIKLVTTDTIKNQLVSGPNYHATKWFSKDLLAMEMKKTNVKMNKQVYLGLSILKICKIIMYTFWYDYIKPKFQGNAKLCYMELTALLFILKLKIFMKMLLLTLKNGLTYQIIMLIDHYQKK